MPVRLLAFGNGHPLISIYSSTEIGANAMGWCMVEDHQHILHFGCNALVSFDGDHWRIDNAGNAYAIRGLDVDSDGRIWACGIGELGWFERDHTYRWQFHSLRSSVSGDSADLEPFWKVYSVPGGAVFVSEDRLLFWNGHEFKIRELPGARRLSAFRVGDEIYVHHLPTGLFRINAAQLELVIPAQKMGRAAILWMDHWKKGWLLATSKGLFTYSGQHLEAFSPVASGFIRDNGLTAALKGPNDQLVLGTLHGGILLLNQNGTIERNLTVQDGLPTNEIFSLSLDHEQGLWATSSSYIFRVSINSRVSILDGASGIELPCEAIMGIANGVALATGTKVMLLNEASGESEPIVQSGRHFWSLFSVPQGLLIGSNFGLDLVNRNGAKQVFSTSKDVYAITSSLKKDSVLVSVGRSILRTNLSTGETETLVGDLPDIATSLAEDKFGNVWVGSTKAGLMQVNQFHGISQVTHPVDEDGSNAGAGSAVVNGVADGTILAFSSNNGYLQRAGATKLERIRNFPRSRVAASINSANPNAIWTIHGADFGGVSSLGRVRMNKDYAIWEPVFVEGLWRIGSPTTIFEEQRSDEAVLWIGGTRGVLKVEGPLALGETGPPKPIVVAIERRAGAVNEYEIVQGPIKFATRDIVLDIAIPSFASRPGIVCETRIDDIDSQWIPLDPTGTRRLLAMRDGSYRIRTRATFGDRQAETIIGLTILPPWWRTWTFETLAAAATICSCFAYYRYRLRSLCERAEKLEEMVRSRTKEIERANAAKSEIVAHISHDIRNPLNGIVGLTYALENSALTEEQSKLIRGMRSCASFMTLLAGDVLDLAKIEAGTIELCETLIDPHAILEAVVEIANIEAGLNDAILVILAADKMPINLVSDAGRIEQILVNFAVNAVRYAGGRIELSVKYECRESFNLEFSVRDFGPGIDDRENEAIFDRFYRSESMGKATAGGSGLGLFVCKRIASLIKGSVGVESKKGHGARFFLKLQCEVFSGTNNSIVNSPLVPQRVLLVEDGAFNLWAASTVLEKVGIRVLSRARTAREAIRAFETVKFDLVLLDCNLPDGGGVEVCRRMRAIEGDTEHVKIIAVTAYSTANDQKICLEAGMDGFVGKPLTPEKIRRALFGGKMLETQSGRHEVGDIRPVVDVSLIKYLAGGSQADYEKELARYLDILRAEKVILADATEKNDRVGLASSAHRLLGHAKFLGARALADAAQALEECIGSNLNSRQSELLGEVEVSIRNLDAFIYASLSNR